MPFIDYSQPIYSSMYRRTTWTPPGEFKVYVRKSGCAAYRLKERSTANSLEEVRKRSLAGLQNRDKVMIEDVTEQEVYTYEAVVPTVELVMI